MQGPGSAQATPDAAQGTGAGETAPRTGEGKEERRGKEEREGRGGGGRPSGHGAGGGGGGWWDEKRELGD